MISKKIKTIFNWKWQKKEYQMLKQRNFVVFENFDLEFPMLVFSLFPYVQISLDSLKLLFLLLDYLL